MKKEFMVQYSSVEPQNPYVETRFMASAIHRVCDLWRLRFMASAIYGVCDSSRLKDQFSTPITLN